MAYVLVSQGIVIYRTNNKAEAEALLKDWNEEDREYLQRCYDNGERAADNEVFMYEESADEEKNNKQACC